MADALCMGYILETYMGNKDDLSGYKSTGSEENLKLKEGN